MAGAAGAPAVVRGELCQKKEEPEHKAQQGDPRLRKDRGDRREGGEQKRAQERPRRVEAVHLGQALRPVIRVVAHQHRAGVERIALGDAHEKEGCHQDADGAEAAHEAVPQRISQGEKKDGLSHAGLLPENPREQPCQHVSDGEKREQGPGHREGKAEPLLQERDHNAAGDGADAAEKERKKSCALQMRIQTCHDKSPCPLMFAISSIKGRAAGAKGKFLTG